MEDLDLIFNMKLYLKLNEELEKKESKKEKKKKENNNLKNISIPKGIELDINKI